MEVLSILFKVVALMISILWSVVIVILYLFFIFTSPVKAPPPDKVVKPVVQIEVKETPVKTAPTGVHEGPTDEEALIARGKEIYTKTCVACHNKDPNIKGPIGPELVDAPLEVMTVKVRTGRYPEVLPPGFVPKRKTKLMKKFPQLEADVPAIHAYVQSLKKK